VCPGVLGVVLGEELALATVEIHDGLDAGLVECAQQLRDGSGVPARAEDRPQVVVGIDDAELRLLDEVLGQPQANPGSVIG